MALPLEGAQRLLRANSAMTESRDVLSFAAAIAVLLAAVVCVAGQSSDGPDGGLRVETGRMVKDAPLKGSIRGRVVQPGGRLISQSLKVSLLTLNGTQGMTFTNNQGWFEFGGLEPGYYEVQVETSGADYQVVSQSVQVLRGPTMITMSLKDAASAGGRAPVPAISIGELDAKVPKEAKKEFQLASKAAQEDKSDEAITHLRRALKIYPNFVMARSDLGAQLLAQGKLDEAAEELRQAIQVDDKAFNPKLNLGIVLVEEQSFAEAVDILNRALALNSSSPSVRLYLGLAEMGTGNLDDAEKQLKTAYSLGGSTYSMALFHLGQLYINKGERERALQTFETYLQASPGAPNADQVRKLIAMLR